MWSIHTIRPSWRLSSSGHHNSLFPYHAYYIIIIVAQSFNPQLNQSLLERDQEISSLQHKLQLAEAEVEKSEEKIKQLKSASDEGETHRTTGENLARKVQLLEEELDKAEKDLKETTEKWVLQSSGRRSDVPSQCDWLVLMDRLRQVDVKAEHFERQVTRAEQERDDWEQKHSVSFLPFDTKNWADYDRRLSRSTSNPSESSTSSSPRWRVLYVSSTLMIEQR
jgi:tropomyosin